MNKNARVDKATVDRILKDWPEVSRQATRTTIGKYGLPHEAMPSRLLWHDNGPWRRTVIYAEEVEHNFPTPHHDVLEQYIPYDVPVEKFDELAAFDGSVLVDRTKGEMSARCEGEEANFLALNLAHRIVMGAEDADSARSAYGEAFKQMKAGKTPEIMTRLMFEPPRDRTGYVDRPII